jgi:hypothetical protein
MKWRIKVWLSFEDSPTDVGVISGVFVGKQSLRNRKGKVSMSIQDKLWFRSHKPSRDNPVGADGGGRTHTLVRVPDFESSASANSATSATKSAQYKSSGHDVNKFVLDRKHPTTNIEHAL